MGILDRGLVLRPSSQHILQHISPLSMDVLSGISTHPALDPASLCVNLDSVLWECGNIVCPGQIFQLQAPPHV